MDKLAEREGFEPPVPRGTTVFKTAAIDHSAISPSATKVEHFFTSQKTFIRKNRNLMKKKKKNGCFFETYF